MNDQPSSNAIRRGLDCGKPGCECSKSGVKTHCPGPSHANGDRNPSLGVTERDGKVLLKCYGGCDQDAVIGELQDRDLWPRKEDRPAARANGHARPEIVAEYDYQQADGGLNFQVIRFNPKDFRQRRPNTNGGWDWKAGDRSLLYHLPDLLAADDQTIVFAPEGEKDVDRLRSLGLVATTSAGGAGKWSDSNSRWLAGRRVALLADNDAAGEKDVALKLRSLRPVAGRVALVPLDGLPAGGDISDWLDAGGTPEMLLSMAEAALVSAPAPESRPALTVVERPPLPAFPTDVMSPSLVKLIESASTAMLVPADFLGLPLLVLAGAIIGNAWEIELKGGWKEGPNLYGAIVAGPGSKKTPALKIAQAPIHRIQDVLEREYAIKKRDHAEEMVQWEKVPKKERDSAPPEPPQFHHVHTADATTEALAVMLRGSKGIAVIKDELVGWVTAMDVYHGGKGADRQHYLSMWSRSPIKIDRKSSPEPIIVSRPCLSVVGGIQPDMLPEMLLSSGSDDGFVDRMLWSYPESIVDRWTTDEVDPAAEAAVDRLFENLFSLQGVEIADETTVPRVARMDADAKAVWKDWYDAHAAEMRSETLLESLRGPWAKLPAQYARLSLILHVTHAVDAGRAVTALISGQTMAMAGELVDFFKEHAREALAASRAPRAELEDRIIRGLKDRGPSTFRTVYLEILKGSVKTERARGALERLVEQGKLNCEERRPEGPKGGRPGKEYSVVMSEFEMKRSTNSTR